MFICWQVGREYLVDASQEEEACSSLRVAMGVDREGHVTSANKEGDGGIPYHKMNDIVTVSTVLTIPYN